MMRRKASSLRLRACSRCGGDAYLDTIELVPEWRCLQCARVVSDSDERPAYADPARKAA